MASLCISDNHAIPASQSQVSPKVSDHCIICKQSKTDSHDLKDFNSVNWSVIRAAAGCRKTLKRDKFLSITELISTTEEPEGNSYHSKCLSGFCAVKRSSSPLNEPTEPLPKTTRFNSSIPATNKQGVLGRECIFCGKTRKRRAKESEPLHKCISQIGSRSIVMTATRNGDARILALGEDLIAKEAHYHNTCRREYVREVENKTDEQSYRKQHDSAFRNLSMFIEKEVVQNETPMLATTLLSLYKEEFIALGGIPHDIDNYTVQHLMAKVKERFKNINISKQSNTSGNIIYPGSMTIPEAFAKLNDSDIKDEAVRCVAMTLRTHILAMPKSTIPSPTSIHTLKDSAPQIPDSLRSFFQTLFCGLHPETINDQLERKIIASASDAVFICTKGAVRPWKHQTLGLGLGTLTGSKALLRMLNRLGHCISYDEVKRLETEIAYTCTDGDCETPAGMDLSDMLGTACAWDNYDVNTETVDGKNTLHSTVGICYQNKRQSAEQTPLAEQVGILAGRMRRSFDGRVRVIPPFITSLKQAKFKLTALKDSIHTGTGPLQQQGIDFVWLLESFTHQLPLFTGFYSKFVNDYLPQTAITYMDPIALPPTRNDVVQETMVRTLKVKEETNQKYAVVTYDLAVALKAYSIQALQSPVFDKLIILLGNFHLEMAFFGAVGTFIAESGIEYLLTEVGILAEGSLIGFIKGKFYNRCTRVHQIIATTMERALLTAFYNHIGEEESSQLLQLMADCDTTTEQCRELIDKPTFIEFKKEYDEFVQDVIDGKYGATAAYWAIYIYLINRVYRELQRALRTNDVHGYVTVLPTVIDVFFALNRPNYARWGSLFLDKLQHMDPDAQDVLNAGAFSIRRTTKSYARNAIDLTLEQTVNRDAASPMKGISAFTNSENAFWRWSVTLTQRGMALTELRDMVGLQSGEEPANQVKPWRIKRDNADVDGLMNALNNTCNPFASDSTEQLVNVSSGKAAKLDTKNFLLGTLDRGRKCRLNFVDECAEDESRLQKTVRRTKMLNFASENTKMPQQKERKLDAAEGVRDIFGRIISLAAKSSDTLDLRYLLSYTITDVPLALSHSDGTPLKTEKATLTKALERRQEVLLMDRDIPAIKATVIDGGLLLHETVLNHSRATYGAMARDVLVKVCASRGDQIHLVLDKYQSPSIKDGERNLRGAVNHVFVITGPDQAQKQSGVELLKNGSFKEEFARFLMEEWTKLQYSPIIGRKTVFITHGGKCMELKNINEHFQTTAPDNLQAQHEEADTLIAFHARSVAEGTILVRSTDTDVLVILLGLAGRSDALKIILDYGSGNHRRYINVSLLAANLEEKQHGLTEALIGLHALTGCDFTSCFFRKGKVKPFERLEKDVLQQDVTALRSLTTDEVDILAVTSFVCSLYGFKTSDINEARYKAFMRMCGGKDGAPLARIKKINCASLPPCRNTLEKHIKRSHFVARLWRRADTTDPTGGWNPTDYGWKLS